MHCISFYSDFTYYNDATKSPLNLLRPYSGEVKRIEDFYVLEYSITTLYFEMFYTHSCTKVLILNCLQCYGQTKQYIY